MTKQARRVIGFKSQGVKASDYVIDEDDALKRAEKVHANTNDLECRRASQAIEFDTDRVFGVANLADIHAGSSGVDYQRLIGELELINRTPGLFATTVGDMVDNFVLTKLAFARRDSRLSIGDEWAITRKVLKLLAPKHLLAVGGQSRFLDQDAGRNRLLPICPDQH